MKTLSLFSWLRAAVVCAAVGFASPVWADIPASAYVQDGLIAQWDGIDNAGTGTHDPNATTWVDLKGENNLTLTKVTFGENFATFASGKAIGAQTYTLENGLTFEVYARSAAATGDMLSFQSSSTTSGFNFFCYSSHYRPYDGSKASFAKDETAGMSVVVSEDGLSHSFYKNGSYVEAKSYTSREYQNLFVSLGVLRDMTSGRTLWNGSMYSVRVYNRVLSAGEIACNANLDKIRFNGMNPASLTWPDGYRWNSGTQKIECGIVIDMPTGGLVTVDDVDIGARYEGWVAMGTERTVKICATPIAGWRFVGWEDECGVLTAAEKLSPTLTVTTRKSLVLEAAFCFDLPASAYVQNGIVAQWDGVENAGEGMHDPDATTWKALVGDIDFPLTGCEVSADTISIPGGVSPTVEQSVFSPPDYSQPTTIEFNWATPDLPEASSYSDYSLFAADESVGFGVIFKRKDEHDEDNCAKIREVRIPDSCTTIGTSAFSGCALTNVLPRVLPPQIKSVGVSAMRGFSVKIPELILDNPALTQLGSAAFYGQSFGLVDLSKSSFIGFKNGWEFDAGTIDEFVLPPCCTNLYNPGNGVFGTVRKLCFTGNPPMVGTGTNVLDSTITTYYVPFHNGAWNRYLADHPDWVQPMTAADQKAWKDMMKKYFPNDPLIPRPKQKLKLNGIGDFRYLIRYGGGLMVILRRRAVKCFCCAIKV